MGKATRLAINLSGKNPIEATDAICAMLKSDIAQKQLTGIRGLMNHVASWSGRVVDRSAFLNDPNVRLGFEHEATCLKELLNATHRQLPPEALSRLRGGARYSRCEFVIEMAGELQSALTNLLQHRFWPDADDFAKQVAGIDWPLVSREIDREVEWIKPKPPTDGPYKFGVVRFGKNERTGVGAVTWRLIKFMWNRDEADELEAYQAAKDDHAAELPKSRTKGLLHDANDVLLGVLYPGNLSKVNGKSLIRWNRSAEVPSK